VEPARSKIITCLPLPNEFYGSFGELKMNSQHRQLFLKTTLAIAVTLLASPAQAAQLSGINEAF